MTSPLRRKRPITALNTPLAKTTSRLAARLAQAGIAAGLVLGWAMPTRAESLITSSGFRDVTAGVSAATVGNAGPTLDSKLKWRNRSTPAATAEEPAAAAPERKPAAAQPAAAPSEERAPERSARRTAARLEAKTSAVKPAVAQEPAGNISSKSSRARMRDSVMQVSAQSDAEDPFVDDKTSPASENTQPIEPSSVPPTFTEELPEPAGVGNSGDPFPDDEIPEPPAREVPAPTKSSKGNKNSSRVTPSRLPPAPTTVRTQQPSAGQAIDDMSDTPEFGPGLSAPGADMTCDEYQDLCRKAFWELQNRDIRKIPISLQIEGVEGDDFPCDCRPSNPPPFEGRHFAATTFTWKATGVCHKPLYFEDVQLERYGHSWNPVLQPFMSAGHFFVSIPLLPYKMGLTPPNECMYTLGYYRPGSCAPYMLDPIPFSLRAALFEAVGATAFGLWFWAPGPG